MKTPIAANPKPVGGVLHSGPALRSHYLMCAQKAQESGFPHLAQAILKLYALAK